MKEIAKQSRKSRKGAIALAITSMGMLGAAPAMAQTEIDQLKRELSEQRAMIQQLMGNQKAQAEPKAAAAADPTALVATFYGTLDVDVISGDAGYGTKTTVGSGGMAASNLGVKASKTLDGTLQAVGEFEAGLAINTGVLSNGAANNGINQTAASSGGLTGTGSQIFSRQAYVGLAGSLGTFTVGRQYTPSYLAVAGTGASMGGGFFGNSATLLPSVGGMPTRWNNSLVYKSPSFSGFNLHVNYTTGSQNNVSGDTAASATTTNDKAGQGVDLGFGYRSGALAAALTTWSYNNTSYNATGGETGLATKKGVQLAANYDLGFLKLYGTYVTGTIDGGNYENVTKTLSSSNGSAVSAVVPFGVNQFYVSYSQLTDNSPQNKSTNLVGLAYTYEFSKAQKLYVSWGKMNNNSAASYNLIDGGDIVGTTAVAGFQPQALAVGLNLKF